MTAPKEKAPPAAPRPRRAAAPKAKPSPDETAPAPKAPPVRKPAKPRAPRPRKPSRSDAPPAQPFSTQHISWIIGAVVAVAVLGTGFVLGGYAFLPGPGSGKAIEVPWTSKANASEAAHRLADRGLVSSELLASWYLRVAGDSEAIEVGTHLLADDMSPRTLLRRLLRMPGGTMVKVTIPEGFNQFDVAKRLQEKGICSSTAFLAAARDASLLRELRVPGSDAEGYLFPATYEFGRNAEPAKTVRRMTIEADRRYAEVFDKHAQALAELKQSFGWSRGDVINLASVVEKEAAVADERPIIAGVFMNRLRDPSFRPEKRLQSDPTAVYGCLSKPEATPTCAQVERGATGPMVRDPLNSYSTYAHPGLPPGPIANPSVRSVEAVLAPASTKFYFFVATGNGHHTFSETYQEHRNAIPPAP